MVSELKHINTQLYFGNIYKYCGDDGNVHIGIYMCETNLAKKICLIPLEDNDGSNDAFKIQNLIKVAYPKNMKEIQRSKIKSPLMIKGKIAKVSYSEYIYLSNIIIAVLSKKIENTYANLNAKRIFNHTKENYALTEDYYKYLTWFEHKTNLEFDRNIKRNPGIIKYAIYYIEIGENIGSELHKLRPALIFKKCVSSNPNDSSYIVLPVTSKASASKYWHNTPITINGKQNYIKINDIRRVSLKRIVGPLYKAGTSELIRLTNDEINLVNENFKKYFIKSE